MFQTACHALQVPTILEQLDVAAGSKALSSTVDDAQVLLQERAHASKMVSASPF